MTQLSRLSFYVLLLALAFVQACSSNDDEMNDTGDGAMDAPMVEVDAPSSAPTPMQDTGDARTQRNAAYIEAFLNKAQRLLNEGKAEGAKAEILKALALDD